MNNSIKESYCSFEVSKMLKEAGFDVFVENGYYGSADKPCKSGDFTKSFEGFCYKPTHALAIEWIRVNFGIWIGTAPRFYGDGSLWYIYECIVLSKNSIKSLNDKLFQGIFDMYNTPQEATEAALKYVLENLIK